MKLRGVFLSGVILFGLEKEILLVSDFLFKVDVSLLNCWEGGKEEKVMVLEEVERVGDCGVVGVGVGLEVLLWMRFF